MILLLSATKGSRYIYPKQLIISEVTELETVAFYLDLLFCHGGRQHTIQLQEVQELRQIYLSQTAYNL